jgi:hypothetical protein
MISHQISFTRTRYQIAFALECIFTLSVLISGCSDKKHPASEEQTDTSENSYRKSVVLAQRPNQISTQSSFDVPLINPRASLQPLAPGFMWTYRVHIKNKPKCLRWFTEDFTSGIGFAVLGLNTPFDDVKPGDYTVQYTVTDERKTYVGTKGKGSFFKIKVEDLSTGQSLTKDEILYWGHWKYGNSSDLAICEVRYMGSVSKQILETPEIYPPGASINKVHFRYLSMDVLYDWPQKGEVAVGSLNLSAEGEWSINSKGDFVTCEVDAGSFQTIVTTFEYDFSGYTENKIVEKLYYAPGKGLIKWTQSEDEEEIWTCELVSYLLSEK